MNWKANLPGKPVAYGKSHFELITVYFTLLGHLAFQVVAWGCAQCHGDQTREAPEHRVCSLSMFRDVGGCVGEPFLFKYVNAEKQDACSHTLLIKLFQARLLLTFAMLSLSTRQY